MDSPVPPAVGPEIRKVTKLLSVVRTPDDTWAVVESAIEGEVAIPADARYGSEGWRIWVEQHAHDPACPACARHPDDSGCVQEVRIQDETVMLVHEAHSEVN